MKPSNHGESLENRTRVFNGHAKAWDVIDHRHPGQEPPGHGQEGEAMSFEQGVWKTIIRYVGHNATSVTWSCIYFGIAVRHIDASYERRMLPAEVLALDCEQKHHFSKARKVFGFRDRAGTRGPQILSGYTPLSALLEGELREWRDDPEGQERRREALGVIVRAAWQNIETRKWEKTLRSAFKNFTALVASDRVLTQWMSQTNLGERFNETRAAACAREKRKVKRLLVLNGVVGVTAPGGKSESACKVYSDVQRGNHNRAGGAGDGHEATVNGEEEAATEARWVRENFMDRSTGAVIPIRKDVPQGGAALKVFLREQREAAEARRLARMCGVEAGEIDMERTRPSEGRRGERANHKPQDTRQS